ncbi:MAG: carbohydrate binding family 9 domain-containing protein [Prolixibacteraceae bacterium]|nr:carbohydrate binding family 9 domain-containing protein [Prolixibacteraceae bacterium]
MKFFLVGLLLTIHLFSYSSDKDKPSKKSLKSDPVAHKNNENVVLRVKRATGTIKLDGLIGETDWEKAEKATDFHVVLPVDSGLAKSPSEVVMTYDDKAFYLGVTFFDTIPGKRIMESFRRDFVFGNNDNFLVFFDTFLDQTNGFSFGASVSGAKWDGTQSNGGAVNLNWDCKWDSKTIQYNDRWVTEMRIPFRSVRFKSGTDKWYVNFSRLDLKTNEKSAWAPVPRQFATASLAYTGVLQWEEPLPKSKMMFSVIPYVFGSAARNFEAGTNSTYRRDFGFDAKLGITTSMNLDLTYNPDFSQAEVDQQVTNLDRFELFFPEKRQFFLENSDLFSNYGFGSVTPFFSRRIGLDAPVLAGTRLSGKIGNNWRLGLLDMQTEKTNNQLSRNFMVVSLQRKLFSRSNIGMILVNKEYMDEPGTQNFNRIAGIDYNLASRDNAWSGKLFYHRSFSPANPEKQYAQGASLSYNTRRIHALMAQASVGENYSAEAGYVRRTGYNLLNPEFSLLWVPNKRIVSHGIVMDSDYFFDAEYNQIDHEVDLLYKFEFNNRATLDAGIKDIYTRLDKDFDPTHISSTVLRKGTEYSTNIGFIDYISDMRTLFNYSATVATGGFYSGKIGVVQGKLTYRYQPYLNMSVNFSYNDINLPAPFERARFWLLGPKLDLTLSDKVFFSSFVQYNEQIDNMNINLRFQWRYKPVSDLFVVYTDNYYTGDWSPRNRALVLKLSYWFN